MNASRSASPDHPAITLLIVDDEHQALKYFARLFSSDFEVITCQSAEEAEAIFEARQGKISVIVSDHQMPTTTGVTLLARVKERWPQTVRLLTTAYADTESLAASINEASVHRYIAKPWDLDHLRDVLKDASQTYARNNTNPTPPVGGASQLPPLVGAVAHELATPLLSIEMTSKSILHAVRDQLAVTPAETQPDMAVTLDRFARAAQRIGEDAARARRLARSLAELARDSTARSAFMRITIAQCVRRAVESFPYQDSERSTVSMDLADDFSFVGTEVLMTAVMTNVLSNALDATRKHADPRVWIELKRGDTYNSVFVRDSGSGVPQHIEGSEFKPFVTGKDDGTGLGLSICDWIVRSFGGGIALRSITPPAVTELEIRLPHPSPHAART
ncbi:MAG: hybrid sensor histidine kinase/response regulator [Hyphomicrobiaceae bacterium]|nr:hybrid sensor histidine kinase/response regulator [Hyphomicrobiaceae bacterium]